MYHPDEDVLFLSKYFFDSCHRMKRRGLPRIITPRRLEVMPNTGVSANLPEILFSSTIREMYGREPL